MNLPKRLLLLLRVVLALPNASNNGLAKKIENGFNKFKWKIFKSTKKTHKIFCFFLCNFLISYSIEPFLFIKWLNFKPVFV